jgi:hypothetical protein
MNDERREAIVVFVPVSRADVRDLSRSERISVLRAEIRRRIEQMFSELAAAGMADEVDLCDGRDAERVPAGAVLVRGTPRALQKISELDGVAAVADIDTPLPIWLLPV